jgi:hypothetical protein
MRRFRLFLSVIVVTLLGFATLGGQPAAEAQDATPAAGQSARTDVRYVVPFGPDGLNPGLTVTTTEEGLCGFPSSAALDRPDAWDCLGAEGQIYDPCFENPFTATDEPGEVACLESPFTTDVVILTLTDPLVRQKEAPPMQPSAGPGSGQGPGPGPLTAAGPGPSSAMGPGPARAVGVSLEPWDLPWALELANGDRCTLLHGTLIVIAGQTAHYGCENGGAVFGEVDHSRPLWTANYLAAGEVASNLVEVVAAWS